MEAFAARLRAEVKAAGGPKAFAEKADVPLSTLNTYIAANPAEPKITVVIRIARALGKSVSELLAPIGGDDIGSQIQQTGNGTDSESAQIKMLDVVAAAGSGYENDEPREIRTLPFARRLLDELGVKLANARFMTSHGDSMLPTIADGAIVLVDISYSRPKDDGVYIVIVGNEARIKRIGRGWDGKLTLLSDNQRYPMETLSAPEAESLRVAGKVVWSGGKI
jgi:phage repressor protein C with HTH and peptisase S24 domain